MYVKDLIEILKLGDPENEIYVESPDDKTNFFVDSVYEQTGQTFIRTAE